MYLLQHAASMQHFFCMWLGIDIVYSRIEILIGTKIDEDSSLISLALSVAFAFIAVLPFHSLTVHLFFFCPYISLGFVEEMSTAICFSLTFSIDLWGDTFVCTFSLYCFFHYLFLSLSAVSFVACMFTSIFERCQRECCG